MARVRPADSMRHIACIQVSRGCLQQLVALPALVEFHARSLRDDTTKHDHIHGIVWDKGALALKNDLQNLQAAFEAVRRSLKCVQW